MNDIGDHAPHGKVRKFSQIDGFISVVFRYQECRRKIFMKAPHQQFSVEDGHDHPAFGQANGPVHHQDVVVENTCFAHSVSFHPEKEGSRFISRSDEAKKLGVHMAVPYFMARPLIREHGIHVFSSNYNLYGDLSWRVMETLREMLGPDRVEVYSVDEAFLDLDELDADNWQQLALDIRNRVAEWTGIHVSVGIAPGKVLAKLANRLAKKNKLETGCVYVLENNEQILSALQQTPVDDI